MVGLMGWGVLGGVEDGRDGVKVGVEVGGGVGLIYNNGGLEMVLVIIKNIIVVNTSAIYKNINVRTPTNKPPKPLRKKPLALHFPRQRSPQNSASPDRNPNRIKGQVLIGQIEWAYKIGSDLVQCCALSC